MPLRTFYIIIKSDYVDNRGYLNLFPWMKIHGSIEACRCHSVQVGRVSCFHEWKFMALLKPTTWQWAYKICIRFHEWKFMALLKQENIQQDVPVYRVFPWMKIHGSIEAHVKPNRIIPRIPGFPWMKIHGSIEADLQTHCPLSLEKVSMNENSWLYWSHIARHK